MYEISINPNKNRIYVRLETVQTGEGELFFSEIKKKIAQLKPGFTAVSDISKFSLMDPAEGAWSSEILQFMADAGMAKVARVTGMKTSSIVKTEKLGYKVVTVERFEEADALLDQL